MVDYKKTGKYVQTPVQDPTDIYVGKPEEVDYSGKSTRIDDNFTYIASQIGGPEKYHPGVGMTLTASGGEELDTFNIDTSYLDSFVATAITGKQDTLVPGEHIDIDENNVISIYGISQYQEATSETAGLMSAEDKSKLDAIDEYANNYVLPIATLESLGGIIVGDNLNIENDGTLNAVNTTYEVAIPSVNGSGGTAGLLSAPDKEKLDSVSLGATRTTAHSSNGYIMVDNAAVEVYSHPTYREIGGSIDSGKLINGISVDEWGHVTGYSTTNESGINIVTSGTGNVIVDTSYTALTRTLTALKSYLGNIQIGVLNSSATGTTLATTDSLNVVICKLQNAIAQVNTNLSNDIADKLQYKGSITSVPNNASNGDMYKATASFNVGADSVVNGDILIYNNSSWVKIPSGEKADTWRPVYVGATPVLSSDDLVPLKITGDGATTVSYRGDSIVIYTPEGSGGGGGTGTVTYSTGAGLGWGSETTTTHKIFDVIPATDSTIGGVIIGSGIDVTGAGVISVPVISGDGTSVNVNNGVISLVRGTTTNAVPYGDHTHSLSTLSGSSISNSPALNDVIQYNGTSWTNAQLPTQYVYTAGTDNVTINNSTHTISVARRVIGIETYDSSTQQSVPFVIDDYDTLYFEAGTGISIARARSGDATNGYITTLTISNTGGGSGSGTVYTSQYPIDIEQTAQENVYNIKLKYDSNTLGLESNQLYVKPISWSQITNKPDIPTVNNSTITITQGGTTKGTFTLNQSTDSTITLDAGGGGGDISDAVLSDLSDVVYVGSGQTPTPTNGQVLKYNGSNWYNADDDNTEYTAGTGITIDSANSNAISVNLDTTKGLKLVDYTDNNVTKYKLAVNFDASTIKQRNGTLYVDHAEQTSGYVENNSSAPTYTSSTAAADKIQNNTIYKFTDSTTISSITVNVGGLANDFQYATICFKTKSTGTTWSSDFRCIGFDCAVSGGTSVFTPLANTEYQIAIDKIDTVVTGYVLRIG